MKFIVDSLPYYGDDCPFCVPEYDSIRYIGYVDRVKCPRYWDKYFICSDDNPHECEYLIEYDKYKENRNYENT